MSINRTMSGRHDPAISPVVAHNNTLNMNDLLRYFVKSLAVSTASLKKKGILIEKPWALIDDDGEIQKLIFKRDKGLVLSKNGKVEEGSWDYYPEAKALLIDRVKDKILLKEQFIDDNVLILKKDGTDNDFFALANENTLPDYNIPKYLNSLKCKEFKIKEIKLLNGNIIQIYNATNISYHTDYYGHITGQVDSNYYTLDLPDGAYLTENRKLTLYVKNGKIAKVKKNLIQDLKNGNSVEIEGGLTGYIYYNKNKKITINGKPIPDIRITDNRNFIYEIKESRITEILIVNEYELNNGAKIKVEQKDFSKIRKGDSIVDSNPVFPLPDGLYKIKGKWRKIKVENSIITSYNIFL